MSDSTTVPGRDVLISLNRSATTARLLSGVVHEVNNALQVISGTVELLESRVDMPAAVAPALERLRKQSARAASVLSDVQRFTRAPLGDIVRVDVRDVIEHSLSLRAFSIRRAGLSIRLEAERDARFVVMGNRGQLQQALLNLVVNAEEAVGGKRGEIIVELSADAAWVKVLVLDPGDGITIEPRERVFEPFVSTGDPWESAGLGLWTARAIVAEHGGTVTIEDRSPGTGTAFAVRLPAAPEL